MLHHRSSSQRTSLCSGFLGRNACGRAQHVALTLLLLFVVAGCSRPRKPLEEVDWGQQKPTVAQRFPPRERRVSPATDDATAASTGKGVEGGIEQGLGGGGPKDPDGTPGNESRGGDVSVSGKGEAVGEGPGGESGTPPSAELKRPAPALPGRQPVEPALSATEAARSARQLLDKAQKLLRTADASSAVEAALEAYDQVLPHAKNDADCRKLCGQLEGVLNAAGRGRGQAEAVPTRFE
jgi:hypothetical protein